MLRNAARFLLAIFLMLVLVNCGGGGGTTGGTTGGTGGTTTAPSAPGTPTTVAASTQVTISWSAVSGATSYNLYWSTTSGVTKTNGTKITNVSSPYTQTGLTNAATYYYVLTAVNSVGESAASPQASATPVAATITPTAGWSSAKQLASVDFFYTDIYTGAVSVNNTGTAVSLWIQSPNSSGPSSVYANVYQNGAWGTSFKLGGTGSLMPSVSVTPDGDAVAVYEQQVWDASLSYFTSSSIYSRRYNHLTGTWTAAEQIGGSPTTGYAHEPYVVVDSNGNAMAAWMDPTNQVFARRYDATLGAWEAASTQLSNSPQGAYTPRIAVDGNNVFTAVWIEDTGAYNPSLPGGGPNYPTPTARRYVGGSWGAGSQRIGWSPSDFPYGNYAGAERPWIDVNTAGDVSVVWEQIRTLADLTTQFSVDTARFDPVAGTWSAPSSIATNTNYLSWPQVAVDSTGNAMAVWVKHPPAGSSTNSNSVESSSFTKATGTWSASTLIDQGSSSVSECVMGMDSSGNVEVVWADNNGMTGRRYTATTGTWGSFNARTPASTNLILNMSDTGYAVLQGSSQTMGTTTFMNNAWSWILTP